MSEVHQLIVRHGIEEARRQAVTKHERQVIEAAYQVLSDEAENIGFTYSGFALTSLPHRPQTDTTWRREGHNLTMLIYQRRRSRRNTAGPSIRQLRPLYPAFFAERSNPHRLAGGRARPQHASMARVSMGLSIGGKTYKQVTDQARRI